MAFQKPEKDIEVQLPVIPLAWRILIRPYEPEEMTSGGIVKAADTMESEELLTYVGQVVAIGSESYKAITRSGIDMSKVDPKPKVGDWVMYGTYGGQTVRTKAGAKYLVMNDDGIMGIVPDPAALIYY